MADLYKATRHVRWRTRDGRSMDVRAGTTVEFDEQDFDDLETDERGALRSLEDVLVRGLFVAWDESQAGDLDAMGRDELLELMTSIGASGPGEDGAWPHNIDEDDLRAAAKTELARREAPEAAGAAPRGPSRRSGAAKGAQ